MTSLARLVVLPAAAAALASALSAVPAVGGAVAALVGHWVSASPAGIGWDTPPTGAIAATAGGNGIGWD